MMTYWNDDVMDVDADVANEESSSVVHSLHFVLLERLLQVLSPSGVHL